MADDEHLAIIKQGVEVWNDWRENNPEIQPNLVEENLNYVNLSKAHLKGADLIGADLIGADLSDANLINAYLSDANLRGANLIDANLNYASLRGADLRGANLRGANLNGANLRGAILSDAILSDAILNGAILIGANLRGADLIDANLSAANLRGANLNGTKIGRTMFGDNDLSVVEELDSITHHGPSTIGTNTLYKSKGQISEAFLRKCGLSDWEIESVKLYNPDLSNEEINNIHYRIYDLRVRSVFQINPLFISYSHSDTAFVNVLDKRLTDAGVRFWRDIDHAKAGRLEKQIDQAIQLNDVVLLVLSKHSTNSDWVEHEVRRARKKEQEAGKDALCPVALDDSWKTCRWPKRLREQIEEYNILDFSNWADDAYLQKMFGKLLNGLDLFYK